MGDEITTTQAHSISFSVKPRYALLFATSTLFGVTIALLSLANMAPSAFIFLWVMSLGLAPLAVRATRDVLGSRHTLVRRQGYLLLDGDPIEVARVELRAVMSLFRSVSHYRLSLWVLHSELGAKDFELGRHLSLFDASCSAAHYDEFLTAAKLSSSELFALGARKHR